VPPPGQRDTRAARSVPDGAVMISAAGEPRPVSPVRLTLASRLGCDIDGAWWPRTARMARELPELLAVLGTRLGEIIGVGVNWSSSQGPPDIDAYGWEAKHQHVMTISGRNGRATLLIVPHGTRTALAVMVLRRAAGLPIEPIHLNTQACRTADSVVRAARTQSARSAPAASPPR
jgi:hypothetical protein